MKLTCIVVLLCAAALLPALAQETAEATVKRVREVEKANVILHEDLARTQLLLDTARGEVSKMRRQLDEQIADRKRLSDALAKEAEARKQLTDQLTSMKELITTLQRQLNETIGKVDTGQQRSSTDTATLADRIDKLTKKHDDEMAAMHTDYEKKMTDAKDEFTRKLAEMAQKMETGFTSLRAELDKERNERLASEADANKARTKLTEQAKKDRTITYIMGTLLGGLSLAK